MQKSLPLLVAIALFLPSSRAQSDIVDTAIAAGSFNTLVTAVQAAGLEDALRADGPLTVFAPTDEAFDMIPVETLSALLSDTGALQNVLLYHVTGGALDAAAVTAQPYLSMLSEQVAPIELTESGAFIAGSQIIVTDIEASNGVIHVIDAVMLPPSQNIVETAVDAGLFETLVAAVQAAGLVDTLATGGPFTVFAPTDDAFAALPAGTVESLLADPAALTEILLYHVVPGRVLAADVIASNSITTLQGGSLDVSLDNGAFVNESQIIATDILATNGVVHVIDRVLIPEKKEGITYEVTITNLTRGQVFSPPAIVAHSKDISLFTLGQPASAGLAALAEDGVLDVIVNEVSGLPQIFDVAAFDGPILPGSQATATIQVDASFSQVSVAGMLTSTNDTFFASEITIGSGLFGFPKRFGEERAMAWAYDAGTEYNNESCAFIPGAPCGSPGARDSTAAEGYVYYANGVHGIADLDEAVYDWRGPVAQITVRRR